jgi:hypothetical protein
MVLVDTLGRLYFLGVLSLNPNKETGIPVGTAL